MELKLEKQSKQGSDNEKVAVAIMSDDEYVAILQFYAKLNLSIATHLEKEEEDVEMVKKCIASAKEMHNTLPKVKQPYNLLLSDIQLAVLLTIANFVNPDDDEDEE